MTTLVALLVELLIFCFSACLKFEVDPSGGSGIRSFTLYSHFNYRRDHRGLTQSITMHGD